jgi:hypothetical protein
MKNVKIHRDFRTKENYISIRDLLLWLYEEKQKGTKYAGDVIQAVIECLKELEN